MVQHCSERQCELALERNYANKGTSVVNENPAFNIQALK